MSYMRIYLYKNMTYANSIKFIQYLHNKSYPQIPPAVCDATGSFAKTW